MTRDPLARLPTEARLWLGCVLCVLPLGMMWSTYPGGLGSGIYQGCAVIPGLDTNVSVLGPGLNTGVLSCTVIVTSIEQTPGHALLGSQLPARVFLVFAALVLAYAAARRRTPVTKRLVRAATVAMAVATALAFGERATLGVICMLGGLVLVAPIVWQRRTAVAAARPGE